MATTLYNKNSTIINEDGLFHNFGDSILEIYKVNQELILDLFKNRAIVYCYNSPENIAKQILNRLSVTGAIRPQHKSYSFQELVEVQKKSLEHKALFINFLKDNNLPVLMINTSDDITENANKVNLFIKQLQSN